jgi:[protein-PII] uridylyltransferase
MAIEVRVPFSALERLSAGSILADRAAHVDSSVVAAFGAARPDVTVVAVGGYGRLELFPYSDVDLLLLVDGVPETPAAKNSIAEFLRILWDEGYRVSQSVRTEADCCELHEGNLELTISLLDRRYVCGDRARFDTLDQRFPKFLASQKSTIARELCRSARDRHTKYQDTIYHLEPNVKEHPGALRDVHVIHWLSKIAGDETADASDDIASSRMFLYSVRLFLHDCFRRDNNVLSFDAQESISEKPAEWMRLYYRHVREISRAANRAMDVVESATNGLLAQFRDWRGRVSNSEFTVLRERVYLRDPQRLEIDPGVVMRLMTFISRHQLALAADTERRLAACTPAPPSWNGMRELLSLPHCIFGLRAMHSTGILAKILPEWNRVDCLVVRDFYHRYTVDEHTLLTVQALDDVTRAKTGFETRFAELTTEIDRPDLLRLALLLHDIGKGEGDHVARSLQIAAAVLDRLGVPAADRATVEFLIRHHLDLSSMMTSRDLSDPAAARYMAHQVETVERLKLLTLLTYADISSVNPTAMTPWRLEQLWRVYAVTSAELTRELETERIESQPNTPRSDFLEGFPTRYLRTHSDAEIDRHREQARSGTIIDLVKSGGTWQMTVIAPDRQFLLASISGALASFGMNILKAEAFGNRQGLVLDTFVFSDPLRTLELNPSEVDRLRETLTRCVLGKTDVKQLLKKRPRSPAGGRIKAAVSFNNDVSATATLIEIIAEDRPGLLYDLTSAISSTGCNIEVVLIDTEAHKALDVFYVTSAGKKLSPEVEGLLRANLLAAVVEQVSQPASGA